MSNRVLTAEQDIFNTVLEMYQRGDYPPQMIAKIKELLSKYFPSPPILSIPEPFLKYIQDAWDKIRINGEPIKFPVYGGSAFVVFEVKGNKRVYKLNLSLYNSEVTLDEFPAPSSPLSEDKIEAYAIDLYELLFFVPPNPKQVIQDFLRKLLTSHPPVNKND